MNSAQRGTVVSLVVALAIASCGGRSEHQQPSAEVRLQPVAEQAEAECQLAITRASGTSIPLSASQRMRAFMHPPPSEADAEQMVLFAAAYGLEHEGTLPRLTPAELLSSYRQGSIAWLAERDPLQRAEQSRVLIEKHLVPQVHCRTKAPKTEA